MFSQPLSLAPLHFNNDRLPSSHLICRLGTNVSTIGEGGDTTIPSPGRSPQKTLPGIRLHDTLYGRQACPELNSFHQGIGQISPREGLFSCHPVPKRGQIYDIPPPPPIVERLAPHRHSWYLFRCAAMTTLYFSISAATLRLT